MNDDVKLCACPHPAGRSTLHHRQPGCENGRMTARGWAPAPRHLNPTIDLKPLAEHANHALTAMALDISRLAAAMNRAREARR